MSSQPRLKCLVLADFDSFFTSTVSRHVEAIRDISFHDVEIVHVSTLNWLRVNFSRFDVIVLHYSLAIAQGYHLRPALRERLAAANALKVVFVQDEYRWIDATAEAIRDLGISVLFTVVNHDVVEKVYHHDWLKNVRKEVTLTGFVDEALLSVQVPRYEDRKIDVAYRARKVPFWLGSFAMEKWTIAEKFLKSAVGLGLSCDIASEESARLYGQDWIRFLSGTKAVLGTESGASICDFSGEICRRLSDAVEQNPSLGFDEAQKEYLQDDGKIIIHVISPRVFEAAALRTLMIHYPGEYSGRLVAWRHYVPLEKDHSNIAEVVQVIRDPVRAKVIIEAAYHEVASNPDNSFAAMVAHFDRVVSEEVKKKSQEGGVEPGWRGGIHLLEIVSRADMSARRFRRRLNQAQRRIKGVAARAIGWAV